MDKLVDFIAGMLAEFENLFHAIHVWLGTDWTEEEENGGLNFIEREIVNGEFEEIG